MAAVTIPPQLKMVSWSEEQAAPGQTSSIGESGRRYIVDTGVRVRKGTVTYATKIAAGANPLANDAAFEAWHNALNGDDNQVDLVPYGGLYSGEASSVDVTAQIAWSSIADDSSGGSAVALTYSPTGADLSSVLVAGAPMHLLGRRVEISSVSSVPSAGNATVVVRERLPAQGRVNEVQLAYDWSSHGGAYGMGAAEGLSGRLVVPLVDGTKRELVFVDLNTGAPDLTNPVGSLKGVSDWFVTQHSVGGIAYMPDGRYFVATAFANPVFVVVGTDGRLVSGLGRGTDSALLAQNATTAIANRAQDRVEGAAFLNNKVYVVSRTGRLYSIDQGNLFNTQTFTAALTGRGNLDFAQVTVVGRIPDTAEVAGMWASGGRLYVLRKVIANWEVAEVSLSGGSVSVSKLHALPNRVFTGGSEVGGVVYAPSGSITEPNRIYRYVFPTDTAVLLGSAATTLRANLLASDVQLRREGSTAPLMATYAWEEII